MVAEKLVRAGLILAGLDPNDRDSPRYKAAYRDTVYETLFDLAAVNLPHVPVVITGPFTRECGEQAWPEILEKRLGAKAEIHFVWCPPDLRRQRMIARGEERDLPKIAAWEDYVTLCREEPPVFPHQLVVGGS